MPETVAPRPASRTPARRPRFLVLAVAGFVATFVGYLVIVRIPAGRRIDDDAYGGALHHGSWHFGFLDGLLLHMTSGWLLVFIAVLLGIGLVRRRPLLGLAAAGAAGLPVVADGLLRYHVFTRAPFAVRQPLGNTFPSGHAITAISAGMALILLAPARVRGYLSVAVLLFASAVGNQVQVIGWHRPGDVVGSVFLAFAVVGAICAAVYRLRPDVIVTPHDDRGCERLLLGAGGLGGSVAVVAGILYAASRDGDRSQTVNAEAYVAGLGLIVASLAVVLLVLLRSLNCSGRPAGG